MKRRDFALVATGTATVAGASLYWAGSRRGLGPLAHPYARYELAIREYLPTLAIDPSVVVEFAEAWEQYNGPFQGGDERLASTFLLSTDFFSHGEDESRPLQFERLYDPYVAPCGNPLTRLPT